MTENIFSQMMQGRTANETDVNQEDQDNKINVIHKSSPLLEPDSGIDSGV